MPLQGRVDTGVVGFELDLSSGGGNPDGAVEVAGGLLKEMDELFVQKHYVEVVGASERVVRLFGDRHDARMRERVAYALLLKGLSLDNVGRSEDAIQVYDGLIARYGDSAD